MLTKCEHCGEVAVDDTEPQEVCGACGIVVEGINWGSTNTTTPANHRYFVPPKRFVSKPKREISSRGTYKYGLSSLDNLCHVYNLDAMCKAEIADLFKQVSTSRHYKVSEDAAVMAACCLFLTQRKNRQSIPLKSICSELQCTRGKFSHHLKYLKTWLSSNKSLHPLNGNLESQLQDAPEDLSESLASWIQMVCERAKDEERSQLVKKTTELVKLAESCWLLTGRSPKSIVVASAFLCWKSMHPSRRKASFCRFCSLFDVRECMAGKRIPELKALLLKLGQKIPSYSKNYVNERNLLFHLDTILENSETLRNDLFPELNTRQAVDKVEYSTFRIPTKKIPRKEPKTAVKYDSNMNASDIEISDSEIDSYLFSQKREIVNMFDSKPLNTDFKLLKTDSKLLKIDSEPLKTDSKPLKTDSKPLKTHSEPLKTDSEPLKTSSKLLRTDFEPLKTDSEPLKPVSKILKTDSEPLKTESKPLKTESKLLKTEYKPLKTESKPLKTESKPLKTESLITDSKPLKTD